MVCKAAVLVATVAVTVAVAACTSPESTSKTVPPTRSATHLPSGPLVTGRAGAPTDIRAPGIQMLARNSQISFNVGSHEVVITGSDWDTVVATSKVATNVRVEFASGFNWNATTRNRFQYMADLIAQDESSTNFDPLNVVTTIKNDTVRSTVALYNPGDRPGTLSGLQIKVISKPDGAVVGTGDFFTTADSALLIPSKTIIFTTLNYPLTAQPKLINNSLDVMANFHYDRFLPA